MRGSTFESSWRMGGISNGRRTPDRRGPGNDGRCTAMDPRAPRLASELHTPAPAWLLTGIDRCLAAVPSLVSSTDIARSGRFPGIYVLAGAVPACGVLAGRSGVTESSTTFCPTSPWRSPVPGAACASMPACVPAARCSPGSPAGRPHARPARSGSPPSRRRCSRGCRRCRASRRGGCGRRRRRACRACGPRGRRPPRSRRRS